MTKSTDNPYEDNNIPAQNVFQICAANYDHDHDLLDELQEEFDNQFENGAADQHITIDTEEYRVIHINYIEQIHQDDIQEQVLDCYDSVRNLPSGS